MGGLSILWGTWQHLRNHGKAYPWLFILTKMVDLLNRRNAKK